MYAITNVNVFNGSTILPNQAIIVDGDIILDIVPMNESVVLPSQQYNGDGLTATAGFIDLQLNGCGGVLFNTQTSEKTLDVMNRTNLLSGTTQFLPTFITSQHDSMCRAIDVVAGLENKSALGVLGLHLEGPFISKEKKGAHNENHIRTLDELTALYLADHKDQISVVTLAPEHTPQSVIDILHQAGIRVSLGHTNASYHELNTKDHLELATHLYNAMSPLGSREPGAVGYIFDRKPYTGIIVDGIHSDFASVRIAHEILKDNLFMVTDAVTPAGTDMTEYDMAGTKAYVTDGKCHYADGTIAGAAITMIEGVKNLIQHVGISREEALRMASLYPARAIGLDHEYGKLEPGYKANITLLNASNDVCSVYQMGNKRF